MLGESPKETARCARVPRRIVHVRGGPACSEAACPIRYHVSPMTNREDRIKLLHEAAAERILVIGGPYGTYLHGRDLTPADYGGLEYDGCPEQLNITRPDVIADAHRGYLEAGADIIATNTFGGGSIVLAEYGLGDRVREINEAAARLSRSVADSYSAPGRSALRRR